MFALWCEKLCSQCRCCVVTRTIYAWESGHSYSKNPWLCHQEGTAVAVPNTDLLNDEECITKRNRCWKGPSKKARTPPNDICTMVRQRIVHNFVVSHRVERKRHNVMRKNCFGETFLRRNKSRENSKVETLDSHAKQRRASATSQSTT